VVAVGATRCQHCGGEIPEVQPEFVINPGPSWDVSHDGEVSGPFNAVEIVAKLRKHVFSPDDLCAKAGDESWKPLSSIL
jgi:GYF domain 2